MTLPFVGPSYTLALRKGAQDRSVNLHLVGMETPGKAPFIMDSVLNVMPVKPDGSKRVARHGKTFTLTGLREQNRQCLF